MAHHPIFEEFQVRTAPRAEGLSGDFLGCTFRPEWWIGYAATPEDVPNPPPLTEEYFEWADLLDAVSEAHDTFTMIEVGAGFGRWGIRGGLAALQKGLAPNLAFIEAEPQHASWLRDALDLNGLTGQVIEAAISSSKEPVPFAVRGGEYDAQNWYGQAAVNDPGSVTQETYFGRPIVRGHYYDQILAPAITLEEAAGDLGLIDFLDSDSQGAEGDMVTSSIGFLSERVRRVHIGTHSTDVEAICRDTFKSAGWRPVWDFSLQGERETPYGPTWFSDGVQSWINPRLWRGRTPSCNPS